MKNVIATAFVLALLAGGSAAMAKTKIPGAGPKPNNYEKPIRAFLKKVERERLPSGLISSLKSKIGKPVKMVCTTNGGKEREAWRIRTELVATRTDAVTETVIIYYWAANGKIFAGSLSSRRCVAWSY